MDTELVLGYVLFLAAICWLIYLIVVAIAKRPSETAKEINQSPINSIFGIIGTIGVLMFGIGLISFGRLVFDVPTPFGSMKSQWLGALLALLILQALFSSKR